MLQPNITIQNKQILKTLEQIDHDMPKNTERRLLRKVLNLAVKDIRPTLPNTQWRKALRVNTWPNFKGEIVLQRNKDTWTAVFYEYGRGVVFPDTGPLGKRYLQFKVDGQWKKVKEAASLPARKPVYKGLEETWKRQDDIMQTELQAILDEYIQKNNSGGDFSQGGITTT